MVLTSAAVALTAQAQDYTDFPSVQQVRDQNRGTDPKDTAARHAAAFGVLLDVIETTTGRSQFELEQMPPVARGMWRLYKNGRGTALRFGLSFLDVDAYAHSDEFRREVIGRLSEDIQRAYRSAKATQGPGIPGLPRIRGVFFDELGDAWANQASSSSVWFYGVMALVFVGLLGVFREFFLPFGLSGTHLRAGWRRRELRGFTGLVKRYGHPDPSRLGFVLKSASGREEEFTVVVSALPAKRDERVSCLGVSDGGVSNSVVPACRNHTSDVTFLDRSEIKRIIRVRLWFMLLPIALLAGFAYTSELTNRPAFVPIGALGVPVFIAVCVLVGAVVNRLRMRQVQHQLTARLNTMGEVARQEDSGASDPLF